MIEKMEKLYIYSLREQTADIMEDIMRCRAVELSSAETMLEEEIVKSLVHEEGRDLSREELLLERLEDSITALKPFCAKKGLFTKRPMMTYEQLVDDQLMLETMELCEEIEAIVRAGTEQKKKLKQIEFKRDSLVPWKNLDLSTEEMRTKTCKGTCYILQEPCKLDTICQAVREKGLNLHTELISQEKGSQYIAVLFHHTEEAAIKETIGVFGAREFSLEDMKGTFAENIERCEKAIADLRREISKNDEALAQLAEKIDVLEKASDAIKVRIKCLSGQEKFMRTEKVDIITGWIPVSRKKAVNKRLENYECFCEYQEPKKDEDYPILMKNSKLVAPFGAITEMYSLPSSHSIDTNWAIGFFFFLFFGMMLSDAGYGLILIVGGLGGAKLLDIGEGAKRMMKMIGICGFSTMFWGALYGSWFGDAIPKVAETFFGKTVEIPMLLDPLNDPMTILIMSCLFGVVHLFVGMGIKAYIMIKRGDKWGALFDVGFWYIFLIGLPLLLAPGIGGTIGKVMSIVGAAGLVLTQGRAKPTIIGKITSGVMSLYDVTGYFSDVLSYSRILALGLATGVVASVVNIMGTMAGGNMIGAILFLVIFAAGHMLNLGINALGAYVHSARLQYVEFFGKYYEGGGKKFDPLRVETKYVNIMEEK